jgi:exonuclease III
MEFGEIYLCFGAFWNYQMNIYDFSGNIKENVKGIRATSISANGKLIALGHQTFKVILRYLPTGQTVDEINVDSFPYYLEFFDDNNRLAIALNN